MRKTHYLLLVVILFAFHVQSFAYGESEDEFDEIAGQLQGMKVVLENMKQDYEMRLKEMQEKIATLEKVKNTNNGKGFSTNKYRRSTNCWRL
jgi:hypothetical protein